MAKKVTVIPSVLSFERKIAPSDGFMYGTTWENRFDEENKVIPLKIQEKSVLGTISNRLSAKEFKITAGNPQRVDACTLPLACDTLKLQYTVKFLSGVETPHACNNLEFSESYKDAVKKYIDTVGFEELSRRYAVNICNGRTLWRNRMGAEKIEVVVTDVLTKTSWTFNSLQFSMRNFDAPQNDDFTALVAKIAEALSGKKEFLLLEVDIYALLGKGQEIFPSEEMVYEKERQETRNGKKSKYLYQSNNIAAMHSQKIGNAIRTIDTWMPEYETTVKTPIAAEVYGTVSSLGAAFRDSITQKDFYTLFDQFSVGEELDINDQHYIMAILLRGGIFGVKEDKKEKSKEGA